MSPVRTRSPAQSLIERWGFFFCGPEWAEGGWEVYPEEADRQTKGTRSPAQSLIERWGFFLTATARHGLQIRANLIENDFQEFLPFFKGRWLRCRRRRKDKGENVLLKKKLFLGSICCYFLRHLYNLISHWASRHGTDCKSAPTSFRNVVSQRAPSLFQGKVAPPPGGDGRVKAEWSLGEIFSLGSICCFLLHLFILVSNWLQGGTARIANPRQQSRIYFGIIGFNAFRTTSVLEE